MVKWCRVKYHPNLPYYNDGRRVTECDEHIQLSREAACEGMVLLKNENKVLPIVNGKNIVLFGKGQIDYVKGGGGSGEVNGSYIRNVYEGFKIKEKEGKVNILHQLSAFYEDVVKKQFADGVEIGKTTEPEIPEYLLNVAKKYTDTAVITIDRFSGEGYDRKGEEYDGDFYLSREEEKMVKTVSANFGNVIVVLDVGGMVDTSWFKDNDKISSVLLAWQAGIEGGLAIADILCGDAVPSGKLVDTFADSFDAYPSSANFNESEDYVDYNDDIYVGYRYFETIPDAKDRVCYPFGFGLSYTTFDISNITFTQNGDDVTVKATVTNTGDYKGKEVVQVYYSAPQGKLGKPARELIAFKKTDLLMPGESQIVEMSFDVKAMASYDDLGKVCKSAYILEQGTYKLYVGNSVRNTIEVAYTYDVEEQYRLVQQLKQRCAPRKLAKRMLSDGSYESLPTTDEPVEYNYPTLPENTAKAPQEKAMLMDVASGKVLMDEFLAQLTVSELVHIITGQPNRGVANTYGMGGDIEEYGIPTVMTADGPAGLRIDRHCSINTTAFPCATLLACSWDPDLIYRVGEAGAKEVKENNIGVWLTPAMNIHRSPLCGRNFEYYSEDPLIAGVMAAAKINGIQSQHIAASLKHFACNNKETNRHESDSRVSERALREIYIKGFEIAVKTSQPWTIMSSYNCMNGRHTSENYELLTEILREEWGFRGLVTTDWWNTAGQTLEIRAGNDVKMPITRNDTPKDYEDGKITRAEIELSAKRLLEMYMKID
ncbi:MAG: glycoside hydrolase family 3 C-terminal domain-containing protein [Eubacteriales bacterium]|nr:glycoside hydrolase family 3 C-terminal domain-containing protein [Eubacteriales bacterium]